MSKHYLFLDAMGIQRYVFETNTLKIIVGSSLALAEWQKQCVWMCSGYGEIITSAGGNVLACFDAPEKLTAFKDKVISDSIKPPGMEIAWAKSDEKETNWDTWLDLQIEIARYKAGDRDDEPGLYPSHPSGKPGCLFCGEKPADGKNLVDDKAICTLCQKRYEKGYKLKTTHTGTTTLEVLYRTVENLGFPDIFAHDIETMVSTNSKSTSTEGKEMLAVVVIDINNLGNKVKEIVKQDKGFEKLKTFSQNLENVICEILVTILTEWKKKPACIGKDEAGNNAYLRFIPLLVGGDDIAVSMPAPLWPEFVSRFFTLLNERRNGICASAGVVMAPHNFPISRLMDMAEELVGNAKGLVRYLSKNGGSGDQCAVDWYVHYETAFTSVKGARRRAALEDEVNSIYEVATACPYTQNDFENLRKEADKLRRSTSLSNRKLFSLYKAFRAGEQAAKDTLVTEFLRNEDDALSRYEDIWNHVIPDSNGNGLWQSVETSRDKVLFSRLPDAIELSFLGDLKEES